MTSAPSTVDLLADCFRELAGFFGAPLERDDVADLRRTGRFGALDDLARDPAFAAELRNAIDAACAPATDAEAESLLNRSFGELFLGIGGRVGARPIESAHRGSGRLFQEPAAEMKVLLAERGLTPTEGFVEPPDHITIELSLLEQLMRLDSAVVGHADRPAIEAMRKRLASWVPAFATQCKAHDSSGFYAALAAVLVGLLDIRT